jgi:hypothetical protein
LPPPPPPPLTNTSTGRVLTDHALGFFGAPASQKYLLDRVGTRDSQNVIQTIIPQAGTGQVSDLGEFTITHSPTFLATFKLLQYPFPTRLVRLRRRGHSWGIHIREEPVAMAEQGYRACLSSPPAGRSPLNVMCPSPPTLFGYHPPTVTHKLVLIANPPPHSRAVWLPHPPIHAHVLISNFGSQPTIA